MLLKKIGIPVRFMLTGFCGLMLCALAITPATPAAHADGGAPNLAYIAGGAKGISIIDVAQQKVTGSITVDGDPHYIYLSADGRFLYVTQPGLGRFSVIAAKTGDVICSDSLAGQPSLLSVDPGTNTIYVAGNGAAGVSAIDPTNCAIKQTLKTNGAVYGMADAIIGSGPLGGNGNQLWVADSTSLLIFDSSGKQLASIPIEGGPQYITIPTGFIAYVTTRSGNVDAIDLRNHQVLPPLITGGPFGPMDYDAFTGEVYVPDPQHHQIQILTPVIPGSQTPQKQPDRVIQLNGVEPQSIAITSDGQFGFVALSGGNVVMLDIPGRTTINTIFVGGDPHFIITGLYPPLLGTTPQSASFWMNTINIVAYVVVAALLIVPILLIWRSRRRQAQK